MVSRRHLVWRACSWYARQQLRGDSVADSSAIRAVTHAIRDILEVARVGTPFPTASVVVAQTSDFGTPPTEGVTLYLHRVTVHAAMRNLPPRTAPDGTRRRPSLPLDLHYLMTPWARTAGRQQELLGWLIRALEDQPTLPTSVLNREGTAFNEGEVVDIIAQPLSPADLVSVWEFNKSLIQPSMTYVARMVMLDSTIPVVEGGRVVTRGVRHGGTG